MSIESKLIRLVCQKIIYHNTGTEIETLLRKELFDRKLLKSLIEYHELGPLFYLAVKDYKEYIPEAFFLYLQTHYYYTVADNLKKDMEYQVIDCAFKERDIPLLPIKGIALLNDIYDKFFIRPMADIDVLVKEDDIIKAQNLFSELGYEKKLLGLKEDYWRQKQCHLTFCKNGSKDSFYVVELHWGLDFKRKDRNILPELWNRVREIQKDKRSIRLLSPEDTLFSLALHQRRFGITLGLKNVIDAGLLLNKYKNNIDWEYILKEADNGNMKATLFFILTQARFLLEMEFPKALWKRLQIPFWTKRLINRFIEKNTFTLGRSFKNLYLKSHLLLYDNFLEPVDYIINIPKEQFAKFYSLKPYDKKTDFLYRNRLMYMPFKFIYNLYTKKV